MSDPKIAKIIELANQARGIAEDVDLWCSERNERGNGVGSLALAVTQLSDAFLALIDEEALRRVMAGK